MLLKANDVTEIVVGGAVYSAENGFIDAPITLPEANLFGLEPPTAEDVASLTEDPEDNKSDAGNADNDGSGNSTGADNAQDDKTADGEGKKSGGEAGKSGGKNKDNGDGKA